MRVYVASSWRNARQPSVVEALRSDGHDVYDFRNPAPGNSGFSWSEIDPEWQSWTEQQYLAGLQHPRAIDGFARDHCALIAADLCVLVLPCGRSAHLEAGYSVGQSVTSLAILLHPDHAIEPELMYRWADWIGSDLIALRDRYRRRV